jgi:hypothetical protein
MLRRQACLSRLVLSQFCGLPEPGADCLWVARVSQLVARSATHNAILPSHQYEKLCRPAVHANAFGVEYLISFAQVPEAQGLYKVRVNGEIVHIMERDVKTLIHLKRNFGEADRRLRKSTFSVPVLTSLSII